MRTQESGSFKPADATMRGVEILPGHGVALVKIGDTRAKVESVSGSPHSYFTGS
jgi:hypothetical protein